MPQQNVMGMVIQFALIFIIFYFLLIRPQKLKEKEHQKMLAGIDKNDEIVTLGGIHGTVVSVKEKTLLLRIDENVKMEIDRSSVAYIKKSS